MSQVGDSSDSQRIKEMQEAKFRQKVDNEKKDQQNRVTRSFNEVMGDKSRRDMAKRATQNQQATQDTQSRAKQVLNQVRDSTKKQKAPAELGRRAALSRSANALLSKKRTVDSAEAQNATEARVEDLATQGTENIDRIDKEIDREEELEATRAEEQDTEHRLENAQPDRVERDGQQKRRDQQGQQQEQKEGEAVQAAEGPRAQHRVQIPPELIKALVDKIFQAVTGDGRTSMQLNLKGQGLEGVTLKVASENGRVSCSFEGCSPEVRSALRKGKPALTRGLSKKGLRLVSFRVG